MRIAIISPFDAERIALTELLRHDGHEIISARGPRDGLAAAASAHAEVVIASVRVAAIDGASLVREAAQRCPRARLVLLCPRANRGPCTGDVRCLTKPVELDQLRAAIAPPIPLEASA